MFRHPSTLQGFLAAIPTGQPREACTELHVPIALASARPGPKSGTENPS